MCFFTRAHTGSIGLKSCEYGGKNFRGAPRLLITSRTIPALCAFRLSGGPTTPWPEARGEALANPGGELVGVQRVPLRAERDPALQAHRADQRQVVSPVHRPRFHVLLAAHHPGVRSAHRDVRSRFIEEDQALGIQPAHLSQERRALRRDVRPIDFARPRPFFFSTNPTRRITRRKLRSLVGRADGTRRLYSQHNSATVASGASRTTVLSISTSIGHVHPPPFVPRAAHPALRSLAP